MKNQNTIICLLFLFAQIGCTNKSVEANSNELSIGTKFKEDLINLAVELETNDSISIRNISTNEGFLALMTYSDTLKDQTFTHCLSNDLKNENIVEVTKWDDSTIALSLGEQDEILGATHGYLILKKVKTKFKIADFRGGK